MPRPKKTETVVEEFVQGVEEKEEGIELFEVCPFHAPKGSFVKVFDKESGKVWVLDTGKCPDYKEKFMHASGKPFSV